MIALFTEGNFAPKSQLVEIIEDLKYRNNLYQKKQQKQFTQQNLNFNYTNYSLKYYTQTTNNKPFSPNTVDYNFVDIDTQKEVFVELSILPKIGTGTPPPNFATDVWFVIFDGINVLESIKISSLVVPNTVINFTTKTNFKITETRSKLYYNIFIDNNLTIAQKNYINANLLIEWSITINQNQII